ncbi:PrsW family intramembrane metalloprotease [Salinibacterium sp. SYSU T00001]|uniref:PrsW family intramembrane metalloprotease n=1 Tax=Homoserinimonas sedimenticola TaxID=2986805 RepID=UPI0022366A3E|nr:PrsW family intramembrane metalloprotease [Salinibacterium sedimenticola]MCW4386733.1 PrsW family intramembrane metalloprotease [Salinibacterium sedimenticola]
MTGPAPASTLEQPAQNPEPVLESTQPIASGRERRDNTVFVLAVIGYSLLSLIALAVMVYLLSFLGATAFIVAGLLAVIPLAIVLVGITWIDRWEPEPRGALVFAFLWGAAASVAIALIFDLGVQLIAAVVGVGDGFWTLFLGLVVQAPIVEEAGKGLGLLILFWTVRRQFDGPVDGIVYGAMIAVGFAFTENIQYFGLALGDAQGPGDVGEIFLMRGLMSPFAHVMFTACTGIVVGLASRRSSPLGMVGWLVLGLVPAILLHAFWNGSALFVTDFYAYYFAVQVPLFIIGFLIVYFLRTQERALTWRHLQEYAAAGWFTAQEVGMLSTGQGRRAALAWAKSHGVGDAFEQFSRSATRLAFARHRIVLGRDRAVAHYDEGVLLEKIVDARRRMQGSTR